MELELRAGQEKIGNRLIIGCPMRWFEAKLTRVQDPSPWICEIYYRTKIFRLSPKAHAKT